MQDPGRGVQRGVGAAVLGCAVGQTQLLQFRDRGFGGDAQRVLVDRTGLDLLQQGIRDGQFAQAGTQPAQRLGLDVVFSPHSPVAFQTLDDRGRFHGRVEFISVRDQPAWLVLLGGIAGVVTVRAGVFQRLGADLHAGDGSKVLHPFLDQDGELPGFLFGRPGVQGCLLGEGDQLLLARARSRACR